MCAFGDITGDVCVSVQARYMGMNISRGLPANEGVGRSFVRSVVVGGGEQIFWFLNKCANGTHLTVEIIPP